MIARSVRCFRLRPSGWLLVGVALVLVVGCSSGSDAPSPAQRPSASLPDPPWRTEPPVDPIGLNADLLHDFQASSANKVGCRPLGVEPDVWRPDSRLDHVGFVYITRYGDHPPTVRSLRARGATSLTAWSDGSLSSNGLLVDGAHRFEVLVPVSRTGTPGDFCTYIYTPSTARETGARIVASLRFIDQVSESPARR